MKTYTVSALKEICKALALNSSGNKTTIFQRIRDSGNECIEQINVKSFHFRKKVGEVDQSLPRWVSSIRIPPPQLKVSTCFAAPKQGSLDQQTRRML
jgi:hypothetical protein